jgi:hypothetical protein
MAEILGVILGALVTIGKIIYDECKKVSKQVTSCGDPPPHHDDDTPVPEDEDEEPHHRIKIELGRDTIRRLIKRNL